MNVIKEVEHRIPALPHVTILQLIWSDGASSWDVYNDTECLTMNNSFNHHPTVDEVCELLPMGPL
jgi:hypothetical protein